MKFDECVMQCLRTPGLLEGFCRLHGYEVPKSSIDLMVDKATGRMEDLAKEFVVFVWNAVWLRLPRE